MQNPLKKKLVPIKELQNIRGIMLPIGLEFLQLVVTGPPGAGKTHYINQIGGWPNEGYIDLTRKGWWKDQSLIYRPREINLGLPFKGVKEALTVFDKEWLDARPPLQLELERIRILPKGNSPFSTNWQKRYIFEFLIPSPELIFKRRQERHKDGYFPVDQNLNINMVERQVAEFRQLALYLHRAGMSVYVRQDLTEPPMRIAEAGEVQMPPWIIPQPETRISLKSLSGWKWLIFRKDPNKWLTLTTEYQRVTNHSRIAHDGKSFEMLIGNQTFRVQPELPLGATKKYLRHNKNWIINTSDACISNEISGFARIKMGETVLFGTSNREYNNLFDFDESVDKRHVTITNRRGDLILTPMANDKAVKVRRNSDLDHREQLEANRHRSLLSLKQMFGVPSDTIEPIQAAELLTDVIDLMKNEPFRPLNNNNEPGGLLVLPEKHTPILIGDLHGQTDNLLKVISEKCLLSCLERKCASLIFLGDAVHSEISGELDDMASSIQIMDLIFQLKCSFPENVHYLRGNHDSFDPSISKHGFLQGLLLKEALLEERGQEYVDLMEQFYNLLPYVAMSDNFIACHASPPMEDFAREDIINITSKPELIKQITTGRVKQYNYYKGYSKGDIKRFRKCLGAPKGTPVIVGHTPLDPFGSVWRNVGAIKNHHILYSAHLNGPAFFVQIKKQMQPITYPAEPLSRLLQNIS